MGPFPRCVETIAFDYLCVQLLIGPSSGPAKEPNDHGLLLHLHMRSKNNNAETIHAHFIKQIHTRFNNNKKDTYVS